MIRSKSLHLMVLLAIWVDFARNVPITTANPCLNDPLNDINGKYITWTIGWDNVDPGYIVIDPDEDCPNNVCWLFVGNYFAYYIHPTLNYTNISLTLTVSAWGLETGTTGDFCGVYYSIDSTQNWVNIATWNDDDFAGNTPIPITNKTFTLPSETANNVGIGIKLQSKDNAGNANDYCYFNDVILSGEKMYTNENTETVIDTPIIASSESSTLNVMTTTETLIDTTDSPNKEYITSNEHATTLDSSTSTYTMEEVDTMEGLITVIVLTCICIIISCIYIKQMRQVNDEEKKQLAQMVSVNNNIVHIVADNATEHKIEMPSTEGDYNNVDEYTVEGEGEIQREQRNSDSFDKMFVKEQNVHKQIKRDSVGPTFITTKCKDKGINEDEEIVKYWEYDTSGKVCK